MIEALPKRKYLGDLYNQKQYNHLLNKISHKNIVIIGDILNFDNEDISNLLNINKKNLWIIRAKDIIPPQYDRSLVLYYKNEHFNKKTVCENDFLAYYTAADQMIKSGVLQSFNKLKIICRDGIPSYYDSLDCEKHFKPIGSKPFDLYCNLYANTVWFSSTSANYADYASKGIVSRNIYDMKKTIKDASVLFDYIYCPIDQSGQYTDRDDYIWDDGQRSTYRIKYANYLEVQQAIPLSQKIDHFIKCVLELDTNPLYNV